MEFKQCFEALFLISLLHTIVVLIYIQKNDYVFYIGDLKNAERGALALVCFIIIEMIALKLTDVTSRTIVVAIIHQRLFQKEDNNKKWTYVREALCFCFLCYFQVRSFLNETKLVQKLNIFLGPTLLIVNHVAFFSEGVMESFKELEKFTEFLKVRWVGFLITAGLSPVFAFVLNREDNYRALTFDFSPLKIGLVLWCSLLVILNNIYVNRTEANSQKGLQNNLTFFLILAGCTAFSLT